MDYKKAIQSICARREKELASYTALRDKLLSSDKILYDTEVALRALSFAEAQGKPVDSESKLKLTKLLASREKALKLVYPAARCSKCGDSGLYNGKPCSCAVALAINESADFGIPLHDFSDSNFDIFDRESKESVAHVYKNMQKIIEKFPNGKKFNVVLSGGIGTGKTYLAGCAAKKMLDMRESVMALSAFSLNNRFLKYHTTFDTSKDNWLDPIIDCNLLIIDDLGTESVLKNVTIEYLYLIINERVMRRKMTIFTTNLSPAQILSRYGERIYSRIFDKSLCYSELLCGHDLRK